jgi:uncharacterized protein YndB with AHSA1/START domain
MARNTIHVDAPPRAVWLVLADPRLYGNWVVGASTTRDIEGRWPEPGSKLHHTQLGVINDVTIVLESEPERRLVLEAGARPLLVTRVDVQLEPDGDGTQIVLDEESIGGAAGVAPRELADAAIRLRNTEAVRRLKRLAEIGHRLGYDQS